MRHFHSNIVGFIVLQDGLRELTTVKPDVESEISLEEHEVYISRCVYSSNILLISGVMFDR